MTADTAADSAADSPNDPQTSDAAAERRRRQVAVALSHDRSRPELPRIVATGRGAVAEQILEIAFANGVKVREDADLAEILSVIDLDSEIPVEAIAAVAEILSHVYRANQTMSPEAEGPA